MRIVIAISGYLFLLLLVIGGLIELVTVANDTAWPATLTAFASNFPTIVAYGTGIGVMAVGLIAFGTVVVRRMS